MDYPPVLSKGDFVRRFIRGEFGNKGPNWQSLEHLIMDGPFRSSDDFHIRSRKPSGAGQYNVRATSIEREWKKLKKPSDFYLAKMAPHHLNVIQGEVQVIASNTTWPSGLALRYSTVPDLPMRDALAKHQQHAYGIIASSILHYDLCPNSYDWLQILLERYPGHVVEFSTFRTNWGTLDNYNTVFWEVRNY